MTAERATLMDLLDEIEAELRAIGFWDDALPPDTTGGFLDIPFEHWLQAVFLPNAREAVATGKLPARSQVGVMALRQYDYHSIVPEASHLILLLHRFDELVTAAASRR